MKNDCLQCKHCKIEEIWGDPICILKDHYICRVVGVAKMTYVHSGVIIKNHETVDCPDYDEEE